MTPAKGQATGGAGTGVPSAPSPRTPRGLMLALARAASGRPPASLALVAACTLALAAALPRLELRTDGAALHPRGDPTVERTARDRRLFADGDELILLLTARPGGPALDSAAGLRSLAATHRAVASLATVQADGVRSVASLVDVAASGMTSLGHFLDAVPEDGTELAPLLLRLRALPWTDGMFLSADGSAAALYAPLEPGSNRRRAVAEIGRWAAAREEAGFELRITGPVVAEAILGERVLGDLARLVPLMVLVVAVLLVVCLRTPGGVVVALGKTLVVLVGTAGLMALAGFPVTLVTTILPVLLLALCVTDEVHVLARLQARLRDAAGAAACDPAVDVRRELLSTLGELYRPVAYTSISTALGFLSFLAASIAPLRHFGAAAAAGILLAMLMTFTLTPALVVLLPASWFLPRRRARAGRRPRRLGLAVRRPVLGLAAGVLLLAAGVPGLLRLTVQDSWLDNFDPGSPLVRAARELDARFWGSYRFDVVLTGPPGLFHRPEGVALVAAVARAAGAAPHVGGVATHLEPLDMVADLLGLRAGAAGLPADALRAVVEVGALSAAETGLHRLVTPDGGAARILAVVRSPDYRRASLLAAHLDRELEPLLAGTGVSHHGSGDLPLARATVGALVRDQLRSIGWTLAGVGLLLFAVNRRVGLTLIQVVPAAAAAWLILAGMGYAGLPLGVATSLFTALTLGVGVDVALHVTYAYEQRRSQGVGAAEAVRTAFESTAAGRRWSTVVLSLGFLVLTASAFGPNRHLGLLLAAAMPAAYLTTTLFVPRMLAR